MLRDIKNILIIRWGLIGDLLFTTPCIHAIRKMYPKARISLIVEPDTCEIVEENPDIDEILAFDIKKNTLFHNLIWQISFIRNLRTRRFDLCIDLYEGGRSPYLAFLSGAKYRLGYGGNWRRIFFNLHYYDLDEPKHRIYEELNKLSPLDIDFENNDKKMRMFISKEDDELAKSFLEEKDIGDKIAILNPGAGCPSKRWMLERFAELGKCLLCEGWSVIVIKNKGQEGIALRIKKLLGDDAILAPFMNLKRLAALVKYADIFVSGDTGPLQMAIAMGTKTVSLFTSTSPDFSGPLFKENRVIYKEVKCEPCLKEKCKHRLCAELIKVEDVLKAIKDLYRSKT